MVKYILLVRPPTHYLHYFPANQTAGIRSTVPMDIIFMRFVKWKQQATVKDWRNPRGIGGDFIANRISWKVK